MKEITDVLGKVQYTKRNGEACDYRGLLEGVLSAKHRRALVYFIGNGGSAGVATHMSADFLKNGGMRTHSMLEATTLTCLANDFGYEYVFSHQLELIAGEGDLLIAISSSGNSPNIIRAAEKIREKGGALITFTGFQPDNALRSMGDVNCYVPSRRYGCVESVHNMILQQIVDDIVEREGMGIGG